VTLAELLKTTTGYLADKGVDSPRVDAELLLSRALGLTRIELYTQHDRPLNQDELAAVRELVRRRAAREPLAYILGDWGFRRLMLKTDARALVPRPETEVLVDRALALVAGVAAPRIADVGTGTGAIALALKSECPGSTVTAIDLSPEALTLARENAAALAIDVTFVEGNLLEPVAGPFELIASNPPYVDDSEAAGLQPEVRDHEPELAVFGHGETEALAEAARAKLASGGALVLECHEGKADDVSAFLTSLGYSDVRVTPDLAGRPRVVEGRWTQ
jgi:release factor glutamine methyltransferase